MKIPQIVVENAILGLVLVALLSGWYYTNYVNDLSVGSDAVTPIAGQTYYLAGAGISSTATSFDLTSFTITQNGTKITDSMMSETFYVTFEPGSRSRQEIASCTTVTQNDDGTATISGCTRGLLPVSPYTADTSLRFAHSGGSAVIFSDPPQLFNQAAFKDNDETITGSWLFPTPLSDANAATKAYVDSVVNGGEVTNAALVVAGTAGATLSTSTLVYLDPSDQEWKAVDVDTSNTYQDRFLGLTQGAGTDGTAITGGVLLAGRDTNVSGLTPGSTYYASSSAGVIDTTSSAQPIGVAVDTDILLFNPVLVDAVMAGQDNTLSGTNTFTGDVVFDNPVVLNNTVAFAGSTTIRTYTSPGTTTWSKPANLSYIVVEGVGGGGGGDTSTFLAGSGGGYFKKVILASALGATETVTVGAAGSNGTNPTTGGNSSFGSHATANGGGAEGAAGGTATGGDINIAGSVGTRASSGTGGNYSIGGSSILGFGGAGETGGGNGQPATGYGAAGAGSTSGNIGAATAGIVIVTEYFN